MNKTFKEKLVCTGNACAVHIQSNKRAYMISTITAIVLAMLIFFVPVQKISGQEEKMLLIFYQIEDVAHQRQNVINSFGSGYKMPQEEEFIRLEKQFHASQDLYDRYQIARQLDEIIHVQDAYLNEIWYVNANANEDKYFHDLEARFDAIRK